MRMAIRTMVSIAAVAAGLIVGSLVPVAAFEVDIDDPNVFGPGEAWEVPSAISSGDSGPWVERLQERLAEAGFRPGEPNGRFGQATLGAVYAFQKVHDLDRDGFFRAEHWQLLNANVELPILPDVPDRVEVDLSKQVLFLVKADRVKAVLPVSSGNGATYRGSSGSPVRARTPEGDYAFYKRVDGWRISYLGGLYRPYYFRGGYAIHGSTSVPPYPASHGCVRVEIHDMDFLTTELELGMPVYVYGQRITREDLFGPVPGPPPVRYITLSGPI
ncbi:MAG: L,D-transpeptidase family protein [Acidimicrobiia bacterium]|nr:L,D-transpeptidase family protein [Acidimicrobiia bacterium]MDH5615373.1 L,D-transpeptidase family protein [Acidimicrobiia bacterium]